MIQLSCITKRIIDVDINDTMVVIIICDRPRQNQPYCAGYQSEIQAYLVAQGDNYHFSLFGIDR